MGVSKNRILKAVFNCKGNFSHGKNSEAKGTNGVTISAFKHGCLGAVSLSGDFEMAWAWRGSGESEYTKRAVLERRNVPRILQMLETFKVPVTWATVGHLFLQSCRRGSCGSGHPDMPRPPFNARWSGDWYLHDPCSNLDDAPNWYAPDLIREILASPIPHEFGTHSFSHIDFSKETSTPELVRKEINACIDAMEPFGLRPRSLVFCHNHMGYQHADLLYELGIFVVRHRDPKIRLSYPERTESGVYRVFESMNLRVSRFYHYPDKAKIFIDETIRRGAAYHLWFHPSDEPQVFEEALFPILENIAKRRDEGALWVATLADLAAYCEAREKTQITAAVARDRMILELQCNLDTQKFGNPELTFELRVDRPVKAVTTRNGTSTENVAFKVKNGTSELQNLIVNVPCQNRAVEVWFS